MQHKKKEEKKALYKNGKTPWRHLLTIPIGIILWFASIVVGVMADDALYKNSAETMGHPVATFTILIPLFVLIIFAIALLVAIIRWAVELAANKKWREEQNKITE